eukprot:2676434-Prymnesium_polylepis.1
MFFDGGGGGEVTVNPTPSSLVRVEEPMEEADEPEEDEEINFATSLNALTIQQTFAAGIMAKKKKVENRSWAPKLGPDGLWLALHAGAARRVNSKFASLAGALSNAWPEMPSIETLYVPRLEPW